MGTDSFPDKNDRQKVIAYLIGCAEHNEEIAGETHDKPEASDLMDGARMLRSAVALLSAIEPNFYARCRPAVAHYMRTQERAAMSSALSPGAKKAAEDEAAKVGKLLDEIDGIIGRVGPYQPPMVYDPNQGKMVKPGARSDGKADV